MKRYFEIIYWLCSVVVVSLLLRSLTSDYPSAVILAVLLLPGALFAKYFAGELSYKDMFKGVCDTIYFLSAIFVMEYLLIILVYFFLMEYELQGNSDILFNPFFLWAILLSLLALERVIKRYFVGEAEPEKFIEFTSERRKVKIELDSIVYIESWDDYVRVITLSGESYKTLMNISTWERVLDNRFIRVHRSYIVYRGYIETIGNNSLTLKGGHTVDVSRRYRQTLING